jgi:hypothetical protein
MKNGSAVEKGKPSDRLDAKYGEYRKRNWVGPNEVKPRGLEKGKM